MDDQSRETYACSDNCMHVVCRAVFAMVVKNEESNVFDQSRIESSLALR